MFVVIIWNCKNETRQHKQRAKKSYLQIFFRFILVHDNDDKKLIKADNENENKVNKIEQYIALHAYTSFSRSVLSWFSFLDNMMIVWKWLERRYEAIVCQNDFDLYFLLKNEFRWWRTKKSLKGFYEKKSMELRWKFFHSNEKTGTCLMLCALKKAIV